MNRSDLRRRLSWNVSERASQPGQTESPEETVQHNHCCSQRPLDFCPNDQAAEWKRQHGNANVCHAFYGSFLAAVVDVSHPRMEGETEQAGD